jgi:hypothetical protein
MPERRYSDAEVAAILSRAADLSVEQAPTATTLSELERIGKEAGLSPELIRQAAAELGRGGRPVDKPSFWGRVFGRLRLRHETVIPGELDDDGPQALLDAIQHELALPGALSQAGSSFVWSTTSSPQGGRAVTVHVSSKNGETTVRVEERLGNLAGGIWGGVMGGAGSSIAAFAGVGGGVLAGPIGAVLGAGLGLALSYGGTRAIYEAAYNGRAEQAQALFAAVTNVVSEHAVLSEETTSALEAARERHGVLPAPERDLAEELRASSPDRVDVEAEVEAEVEQAIER